MADRIRFVVGDAADGRTLAASTRYTLVHVVQALHDMGDPVGALTAFRRVLAPGGAALLGEGLVGDDASAPAGEIERLHGAISALHCVPATLAESPHAHGNVVRAATVREWAAAAGYRRVTDLPIEHRLYRFVRLD